MTDIEKQLIVSKLISTPAGRKKLADSMFRPICSVCRHSYNGDFIAHCDNAGDELHLAASVLCT